MRVLVYDRTCVWNRGSLSPVWAAGAALYRGLARIDAAHGVTSWPEALAWLAGREEPIDELQYWGHGTWGGAFVQDDLLDRRAMTPGHPCHAGLEGLRDRLAPDALVWFRTCQTLGARPGIDFAERLAGFLGARVAGHTYVIGFHQSGLHGVVPGICADWAQEEGLAAGTPDAPRQAKRSAPWSPRTITALTGRIPPTWFARA